MGLQDDLRTNPPCHPRACAIQDCLTKNNYNEAKCDKLIDALYECCQAFYEKNGEQAKTVSCPKPDLLRLKIKQRKEGQ
ncbi:Cx9C motif-containing protein 4, mitochondrial [Coniochaeta pulveracea]|uniref:Cx9C motif-containing protein 4, mitochondrial n=1 Tax=Coniochaeta pulveracea TaxID=177199 RepID=A0A420Y468_9PEZI|nr:Cx9C motif-containing protein 4, mitochondrial [Coniochaeta pulveracea]